MFRIVKIIMMALPIIGLAQTASVPFGSNAGYANGTMASTNSDATAQTWYSYWKTNFTKSCGGGKTLAINDYNSSNAYSEGQGYGLLLAAYMGDKTLFDELWKGYKDNKNEHGVMHWTVSCGGTVSANGATDGDLDAAMALLVANKQWPNTTSPYNYASEATTLITDIKTNEFTTCNGKIVQKPGDYFGGCDCTNPSYYAVGYYRAFGKHVTSQASFWEQAANDGLALLLTARNSNTGLNPAWTDQSGSITSGGNCNVAASGGGVKTDYQFDAARTPWRIVIDYLWWGTANAKVYCDKVSDFANTKGISNIVAGMKTDGSNNVSYRNSAFTGAFAIGAMATGNQTMVDDFYSWWVANSVTSGDVGPKLDDKPYFQNSLRVMYILVATGNFWNPYATGGNNGCTPPSAPTVTSTLNTCVGATAPVLSATGTSLKWYTAATGGTGSSTTPIVSTTSSGNTTYYVTQTVNTCESPRASITVSVNQASLPTVVSPVNYCQNASAGTLSASGTSLKWYSSATGGTSSSNAPTVSTSNIGTQNFWVTQTTNGCESARAQITVNVGSPATTPTVTSPVNYCQNATSSALVATGSNLMWYNLASGGTGSSTAPIPSTSQVGSTTYYVSQLGNGCESARVSIVVQVSQSPSAPTVNSPVLYNVGEAATSLEAVGTTLKWYTQPSGGTSTNVAPIPNTSTQGTTTYYVSQTGANGCESNRASIVVTVSNNYRVFKVASALTIDGNAESVWNSPSVISQSFTKPINGTVSDANDLSGNFKLLWDNNNLYVYAKVVDDVKTNDSPEIYNDDAVEVYVDINNDKASTYGNNDVQYSFGWNDGSTVNANPSGRNTTNIEYAITTTGDGYTFEAKLPWSTLQNNPQIGQLIGFDFHVNDDDNGSERDGKLAWNSTTDDAWQNPSLFGTIILQDVLTAADYLELQEAVELYPNPSSGAFHLELNGAFEYSVINVLGQQVFNGKATEHVKFGDHLPKGIYLIKVNKENRYKMLKAEKH